jgi:hypothetical protein
VKLPGHSHTSWLYVLAGLLVLLIGARLWPLPAGRGPIPATAVDCDSLTAGCSFHLHGGEVFVKSMQPPSALHPFELRVRAPWAGDAQARFSMRGMEMGPNHYRLIKEGDVWKARVVLPICVSGRRDWLLSLNLNGNSADIGFTAGAAS